MARRFRLLMTVSTGGKIYPRDTVVTDVEAEQAKAALLRLGVLKPVGEPQISEQREMAGTRG